MSTQTLQTTIRRGTSADFAAWNEIDEQCFAQFVSIGLLPPARVTGPLAHIVDSKVSGKILTVAEVDGQVVGYTFIAMFDGAGKNAAKLDLIAVHPQFAGRGIGAKLLEHTAQVAKDAGYKFLVASFHSGQSGFFEQAGWTTAPFGAHLAWSTAKTGGTLNAHFTPDGHRGYDRVAYKPVSRYMEPEVRFAEPDEE